MVKFVLASGSPRRRELLSAIGLKYEIIVPMKEEQVKDGQSPGNLVSCLARQKAIEVLRKTDGIVIAADTVVVHNGKILGKPHDDREAYKMLFALSGGWHEVYTGLCVTDNNKEITVYEKTRVCFRDLTKEEIEGYIKTGEPMDKAGAYGIQGLGSMLVCAIEGDYFTVMGLPLCRLALILKESFGIDLLSFHNK